MFQFLRSADFQVWLMTSRDINYLKDLALEVVQAKAGDIREDDQALTRLWKNRTSILEEIRKRLREEVFSRTMNQKIKDASTNVLKGSK